MTTYDVSDDKIFKYLLNSDHPQGRSKAQFFMKHGFATENPHLLREALQDHPLTARLIQQIYHPDGEKLTYQCMIACPDGEQLCITTVWIRSLISSTGGSVTSQRLVTAYPHR